MLQTTIIINSVSIKFILAPGGDATIMTKEDYERIGSPKLLEKDIVLNNGQLFLATGTFDCASVNFNNKEMKDISCVLVENSQHNVMGSNWMELFNFVLVFPIQFPIIKLQTDEEQTEPVSYATCDKSKIFKNQCQSFNGGSFNKMAMRNGSDRKGQLYGNTSIQSILIGANRMTMNNFVYKMDMKNFHPNEINVQYNKSEVIINGRHISESQFEMADCNFTRRIQLPAGINSEKMSYEFDCNGDLILTNGSGKLAAQWNVRHEIYKIIYFLGLNLFFNFKQY